MKKTLSVAVAVLALASFSNAGQAAESKNKEAAKAAPAKAAAQPAKPTPEQIANIKRAGTILRSFNFAMSSKEVPDAVKGRLLICLYENKLGAISIAAGKVMKENGLSDEKPDDVYRSAAGVCGIAFKKKSDLPQTPAPAPAAPTSSTQGR